MPDVKDRGRVLLAVWVRSQGWTAFILTMVLVWAGLIVFVFLKPYSWNRFFQLFLNLGGSIVAISSYLLHPRIKFRQGGVEIPPTQDCNRVRFLRWDQIERSSWDGDRLVLTGTTSVLSGGPVQGGTVRIPKAQRPAVDRILAERLRAGSFLRP